RTFSSRLILEKHVQVRHGLQLGAQSPGRGTTLARGSSARAQFLPLFFRGQVGNAASLLTLAVRSLTARHRQPSPPGADLDLEAMALCATGAAAPQNRAS
ncbi:ZNF687 isoform 7, partial [Pan troglodytes]